MSHYTHGDVSRPLTLSTGDEQLQVFPMDLADEGRRAAIAQRIQSRTAFQIEHLLDWSDSGRWAVLTFILEAGGQQRVTTAADDEPRQLFDCTLCLLVNFNDVDRCARGVQAACEAVALVHPNAIEAACEKIHCRLKELKVTGYSTASLVKKTRELCNVQPAHVEAAAILVKDVLPSAPVPDGTSIPPRWALTSDAVHREGLTDQDRIIPASVVVTGRLRKLNSGEEALNIAWQKNGVWIDQVVPRQQIANARTAIDLAKFGLAVTSNNGADLVQYILDFDVTNQDVLPETLSTDQIGWQHGVDGFMLGHELIRSRVPPLGDAATGAEIAFQGADDGDNQIADGFCLDGSYDGWLQAISIVDRQPRIQFLLYCAFVAPLLLIFRTANFLVSTAGPTSQGKTTALRVAGSVWGNPDEQSPASVTATWDATRVWLERAAALRNGLPLIVDDTKRAQKPQDIAQTIYDVAAGRGRGRGTLTGTRHAATFSTVLISSGEEPLTAFSQDGGTRARVIEIWGSPFCEAGAETATAVNEINRGVTLNYGHAGRRFIQFLTDHRTEWSTWQQQFNDRRRHFEVRSENNAVAHRMASHFGAIEVAAILAHQVIQLPWEYDGLVDQLWPELTADTTEADRAEAALRHIVSWANANRAAFLGQPGHSSVSGSARECYGRWDSARNPGLTPEFLGIYPHKLDAVLSEARFEPSAIRRMWFDRGWLKCNDDRRTLKVRMADGTGNVIAILVTAIQALDPHEPACEPQPPGSRTPMVG